MLATILNLITIVVFAYLILYAIYLLNINLKALLSSKNFLMENSPKNYRDYEDKNNKICILIFANSKSKKLEPVLRSLSNQTYKREFYSTHVVFAKDSNSLLYTPDCMAGAQIHCIENPEFYSKNKALNVFIEKLLPVAKFDAYVFLGASRNVKEDYLENINIILNKYKSAVLTGKTTLISESKTHKLMAKVIEAKQEFLNNTVNISRRMFDLASIIDSENCVITTDILEKTGRICFETKEDELKYSLFLASNDIKPTFCPFMETTCKVENFNPTTSGFGVRFSLFKYYLKLLVRKPWYFIEFVLYLIQPNVAVLGILYLLLLYFSFKFMSTIGIKYVIHLGIFYLIVWILGLIASRISPVKILFFLFYPLYSFIFNFRKITKDISRKAIQRSVTEEKNIKSATMNAIVTDGEKDVMCKMDLISEDGMRRVILRFRKKRVISDESIRMFDAVENISKRVRTHGLTLKICQNCKYFQATPDGTVDLLKGVCSLNNAENKETFETLIWNTCNCFSPKEENGLHGIT